MQKGEGKTGQGDKWGGNTGGNDFQSGTKNGKGCKQSIQNQQDKCNAAKSHFTSWQQFFFSL
jgi:hypothetical protein